MKLAVSNIAWSVAEQDAILAALPELGVTGVEIAPTVLWMPPLPSDSTSRAWIVDKEPVFVMSEAIHTPMGSGIVAFADQGAAEAAAKETGGKLYDAAGMAAERGRWMEERYGKPKDR